MNSTNIINSHSSVPSNSSQKRNKKLMESIVSDDEELEIARAEFEEEIKSPETKALTTEFDTPSTTHSSPHKVSSITNRALLWSKK